jgi:biopolymer transport protein ExbD
MSMNVGGDSSGPMCDVNTTPLIDVLLVLIVTLIITLPVMTHAVKLDLPQNQNPPQPPTPPEVIDLEIDFDGTIVWNGTPASLQQVDGYFSTESTKDPQPEIHLNPDGMAKYDVVAKVLAAAQRNRMTKIGFVNTSEFAQ